MDDSFNGVLFGKLIINSQDSVVYGAQRPFQSICSAVVSSHHCCLERSTAKHVGSEVEARYAVSSLRFPRLALVSIAENDLGHLLIIA